MGAFNRFVSFKLFIWFALLVAITVPPPETVRNVSLGGSVIDFWEDAASVTGWSSESVSIRPDCIFRKRLVLYNLRINRSNKNKIYKINRDFYLNPGKSFSPSFFDITIMIENYVKSLQNSYIDMDEKKETKFSPPLNILQLCTISPLYLQMIMIFPPVSFSNTYFLLLIHEDKVLSFFPD